MRGTDPIKSTWVYLKFVNLFNLNNLSLTKRDNINTLSPKGEGFNYIISFNFNL